MPVGFDNLFSFNTSPDIGMPSVDYGYGADSSSLLKTAGDISLGNDQSFFQLAFNDVAKTPDGLPVSPEAGGGTLSNDYLISSLLLNDAAGGFASDAAFTPLLAASTGGNDSAMFGGGIFADSGKDGGPLSFAMDSVSGRGNVFSEELLAPSEELLARGVGQRNSGAATDTFVRPGQGSGGFYNGDGNVRPVPSGNSTPLAPARSVPATPYTPSGGTKFPLGGGGEFSPGGTFLRELQPLPGRNDAEADLDGKRVPSRSAEVVGQSVTVKETGDGKGNMLCYATVFAPALKVNNNEQDQTVTRTVSIPMRAEAYVTPNATGVYVNNIEFSRDVKVNGTTVRHADQTFPSSNPSAKSMSITRDTYIKASDITNANVSVPAGSTQGKFNATAAASCTFDTPDGPVIIKATGKVVNTMPLPQVLWR